MHGPIYRIGAWLARSSSPHPFLESSPSCQIVPRLVNHLRGRKCGLTHGEAGLAFMNTFTRDLSSNCDDMNDNAPFVLSQLRMATMTRMTRTFMWMSNQSVVGKSKVIHPPDANGYTFHLCYHASLTPHPMSASPK